MRIYLMPACMNDWMNLRWNMRNNMSNGPIAIKVPADITDQSTPDSGAPNIAMPTVNGRLASVLVTTSGHRKLFQ
jgi:hypothetical protein